MAAEANKQTILAVDDTPENIDILVGILSEKYRVKAAPNGERALKIALKNPPDLILLDVMMPVMDGFETCKHLKEAPETKDIPVIFLTAKTETEDIVAGFELGAVDYVAKPFNVTELQVRVNTHMQLRNVQKKIEELATKLSKYLSPQVYDSIFSGEKDVRIETEEKVMTIFFSDIVEFTSTSEGMNRHELTQWLNHYLNEMSGIALRYGGTLDKFIGDAVMVFFGDPKTLGEKQDAVRCAQMAIEMHRKAQELDINIRMGIHSGKCTVGNFGSEERMDYTIIGKSVNLASRLEHYGEPGKIHISEETYNLVKDEVSCEPHGNIRVKGIDRDISTYWVLT
ncbi:MAG: response regulator [SAR324 cluster bacterium]|nr:response regulator [SAR324 cluster bacterium]